MIVYLHTVLRLPIRRIQEYLATVHRLDLRMGEITRLIPAMWKTLAPNVALTEHARASPIRYADGTGWCECGQNGTIWACSTPGDTVVR